MVGRLPLAVGVFTASTAAMALLAWTLGLGDAPRLVDGWRLMVPSTAFSFLCGGLALTVISAPHAFSGRAPLLLVRLLALMTIVLPASTLFEYAAGARLGVERWLVAPIEDQNPYAGRMSALTSLTFVLLATALFGLTWTGRSASAAVRVAGGAALTVSWFGVLAISFDDARISDQPQFPGMAALTVVLFALTSYGVLAASTEVVRRVRDAGTDVALHGGLVASAFALPLVLGPVTQLSSRWVEPELSTAVAAVGLAGALMLVVWRGLARMQDLQQQRRSVLAELEERVAARTTELAAANAQLRASEERLRDAHRHKDEFLAMLSHELRNPLAPIRTGVELLHREDTTAATRHEVHRMVERQMAHLVRLIDDLLDVSRINAGKLTLRLERVDLREVVEQAIEATRPILERARHHLSLTLPPEPAEVEGDSTRLAQVAANLVQNACKYTPPGGQVTVTVRAFAGAIELRVRDNGVGISPEFLPRVFEKFEQQAPDGQGGLGIGLALVRGIVSLHGGSVEASSTGEGQGSEFVVRLPRPVRQAPLPMEADAPTPENGATVPRRVLVVDDNADNAMALALLLRQLGHHVEVAADGEAALTSANDFRPDVVLLDIGIPKLDGYDVCRRLRQQDWGRSIRVIAQTGFGEEQDRQRTADAGFDDHLVKPIDPARLGAVLQA